MTNEMIEAAKEARRKYEREYWSKHPEKAREKARRYWERKAARAVAEKAVEGTGKNEANDERELLKEQPKQQFFVDSNGKITPLPIQPQWISVEDKLPDKCNTYLVYFGKGIGIRMKTAVWLPEKRIWKGIEAYSTLNGITHWMPLPEPPEEVKQDG